MQAHSFLLAIVLASSLGVSGCNGEPQAKTPTPPPQTQTLPSEYQLQLSSLADVELRDRSVIKTGYVTQIRHDAIVLEFDEVTDEIAIADVHRVTFKVDDPPETNGYPTIRGVEIWRIFADRVRFGDRSFAVKREDIDPVPPDGEFPYQSICHVKSMWFKQENGAIQLNLKVSHCDP